jgi:hypothetical protein
MLQFGFPASKLSDKNGPLQSGDKIGITFDHGKIDCKYGKLENGSGILPLILPFGELVIPPIVTNPEDMKKLAHRIRVEYGYLWEEMLDEEIEEKLVVNIMLTAISLINCGVDIWSERGRHFVVMSMTLIEWDDILDEFGDLEESGLDFKALMRLQETFYSGNPDEVPNMIPKLVPYTKFMVEGINKDPNRSRMGWGRKESKNTINALATVTSFGKNGEEGLSEDSLLEFNGYLYGLLGALEMGVLIKEGEVCEEIRSDIVFKRFGICISISGTLMNSIFGLGRDIRLDQVKDTPVLRDVVNNGISLQNSFDNCIRRFNNAVQDVRVLGKKLLARYPGDPALINYVNYGYQLIDKQLYWYTFVTRYGEINAKVQKM